MASMFIELLATTDSGDFQMSTGSLAGRGVNSIRVHGDGIDVELQVQAGYPSLGYSDTLLVAGNQYSLTITARTEQGDIDTSVLLLAEDLQGAVGWLSPTFGGPIGDLSPAAFSVPDVAAIGPTTSVGLHALMKFFSGSSSMCSYPGLVYDPSFNPPYPLRWLYTKAAGGQETVQLVSAPDTVSGKDVLTWLSPTGVPHFLRVQSTDTEDQYLFDFDISLMALQPSPYGEVPAPATAVINFRATGIGRFTGATVRWIDGNTPVITSAHRNIPEPALDLLLVATPSGLITNPLASSQYASGNTLVSTEGQHILSEVVEIV